MQVLGHSSLFKAKIIKLDVCNELGQSFAAFMHMNFDIMLSVARFLCNR